MAKLILCMIVKNEAHVIERCLEYARVVADAACICDTGSTDGTPELTERTLETMGLPHRVCRHEWQNFGHNRTRAFHAARELAGELGWELSDCYALMLDADVNLRKDDAFDPAQLTAPGYSMPWIHGSLRFANIGLARMDIDWRCVGAAHEYWTTEEWQPVEVLHSLWYEHIGDGGTDTDKATRNLQLLEADLREQPDNSRTQFYLAQTYFDLERYAEAREMYQRRVETGGWEEETWYASYKAAMSALRMGKRQTAYGELLEVWNERPRRAEPLHTLARAARHERQHHVALLAAEQALALDFPSEERLFVETTAYDVGAIEEISISAYYAGRTERGAAACDALLHRRGLHATTRNRAALNSAYYARQLTDHTEAIRVELQPGVVPNGFAASVGSIQRTRGGYFQVNRMVNYYHERGVDFITRDPNGLYMSRNLALELGKDLQVRSATEIDASFVEEIADFKAGDAQVVGVEDLRVFRWQDAWWFIGNSRQFGRLHLWQVVLGRLDAAGQRVEWAVPLDFTARTRHEKSWMPAVHRGRLYLLYSCDPTIVIEPDPQTGECRLVALHQTAVNLDRYRGSSPLVPFNGRLLGIVHEVAFDKDRRTYLHRFIVLDPETWQITHASHPFTFLHRGVEYCCGLTWAHEEHELLISFSFEERESWLTRIHREEVRRMLRPVAALPTLAPLTDIRERPEPTLSAPGTTPSEATPPAGQPRRRWPLRSW